MKKIGVFTIGSKNYLAYARTLLQSVAELHPEYATYLCLADRIDDYFDPNNECFSTVTVDQLNIPTFNDMTLRYNIMEFNTAVKPFMFEWLFENTDLDAVIYLDPDILLYSRFNELEKCFEDGASVILTPHITKSLEDNCIPSDYHIMRSGVFNLGFIAAKRCQEAIDYMAWWGRRLTTQCIVDFSNNLFVDQKWCDFAPCFLDNLHVLKHPGYNVAYWNFTERHVVKHETWMVNDRPLVFFHFSGIDPKKTRQVSKYQDRFTWSDIKPLHPLFREYSEKLLSNGWEESSNWPYAYSTFSDNSPLPDIARKLYHSKTVDPFQSNKINVENHFLTLCNAKTKSLDADTSITKLMYFIYKHSDQLQSAFNLASKNGQHEYSAWFNTTGLNQYGLSSHFKTIEITTSKNMLSIFLNNITNLEKVLKSLAKYFPRKYYQSFKKTYTQSKLKFILFLKRKTHGD